MSDAAREIRRLRMTVLAIVGATVVVAVATFSAVFWVAPYVREERAIAKAKHACLNGGLLEEIMPEGRGACHHLQYLREKDEGA